MGRLEISKIMYSELNDECRFEAEYFSKENLSLFDKLCRMNTLLVGDIADVTDGIHTSIDYDENSNINLISATSPRENVFDLSRGAKISEIAHKNNPRTALSEGDVILSTVGTIGNCAVVDKTILPANSDRHVGIIRIKTDYSPYVLSSFLLSKYGRMQTERETTGNVQPNLFIYKIKELIIPEFSKELQKLIEDSIKMAHKKLQKANEKYQQAEEMLIAELGLKDWTYKKHTCSIKSFSDISKSGRIDAEYYQGKYDELEKHIKDYKNGWRLVSELFIQHIEVSDFSYPSYKYIEIGDVNISDGTCEYSVIDKNELPANAKMVVDAGDILISKVRPYRGAVTISRFTDNDVIASSAFTILHEYKYMKKEVLQLLFRISHYKDWLLKWNVGTSYPVIKDENILNLPIPMIVDSIQHNISKLIQESYDLRDECKELLKTTTNAVEFAIDCGKDNAFNLIKKYMEKQ